ncbi:MAG: OmpH family outer membrane protein [Pedobacter sp.]|nr:MAG: OmpH family outer membrane protein [Pedobacter sp.]
MKKLINVFFVAASLILTVNVANAQQKFGHVNTDELYDVMPEAIAAQKAFEAFSKVKQTEYDKMLNEYQTKLKAAQDKEKLAQDKQRTMSEANRETVSKELDALGKELQVAAQELQDFQKRIEDAKTKASKDLTDKQNELYPAVTKKMQTAITAVAKEKGLAYVFDLSAGQGFNNILYADGGEDITPAVKTKLGIAATAPAAAPKK